GSQVPSQRVAKELVTTVAIMARRLRTKNPVTVQTAAAQSFAVAVVSRIMARPFRVGAGRARASGRRAACSALPARGRAAVEEAARCEDRGDDEQVHERT